jgi:NADH dehydrogenase
MKVALIGGTGFVGQAISRHLIDAGHRPRLLVRPGKEGKVVGGTTLEVVSGDVQDPAALDRCLEGTDAVVYLIGILREFPQRGITFDGLQRAGVVDTIASAKRQGVERFVLMSANGIRGDGTAYQRSKFLAEEALKASGLRWTIFRPSVIFGDPEGRMEFCSQLKKDIIDAPLPAPLFYDGLLPKAAGAFQLAPVFIDDVAKAFVLALTESRTESQTYSLCGPQRLSWKEILTTIAAASGKTKLMLPAPAFAIKATAGLFDRYPWFPISRDQIQMLMEGNVCSENDSFARLGLVPTAFAIDRLGYLSR